MFQLDYRSGISICDQIVNGIMRLKTLGVLKNNEQLPSVRSLASKLSVNPNTVQKAYMILEERGITYSVKGKGSFIAGNSSVDDAIKLSQRKKFRDAVKEAFEFGFLPEELNEIIISVKEEQK